MTAEASVRDPERQTLGARAAGVWSAANRYAVVLLLLVGIFCFFSLTQPDFFSQANIENLLTGSSILFVVSIGMTFVVLTGGIDLSVGSLLALSGIILSQLFNDVGLPAPLAVLGTCLAAAFLGGAVNGVLIGRLGLSFFVVTLGTLSIYRGVVNIWSDTETTYISVELHRLDRLRRAARDRVSDLDHGCDVPRRARRSSLDLLRPGRLRGRREHHRRPPFRDQRRADADHGLRDRRASAPGSAASSRRLGWVRPARWSAKRRLSTPPRRSCSAARASSAASAASPGPRSECSSSGRSRTASPSRAFRASGSRSSQA